MIGGIEDMLDLGDLLVEDSLDSLLESDTRHPASLAATAHVDEDGFLFEVEDFDEPSVGSDHWIDLRPSRRYR